ncbi:lytic transglycosylase domain-containing protein [Sphingorhabdus soli]|uniref:Lytic transglycosylase domain-containing protein n=1 Tax=Flavisphingopyxis soli TaxID=2601267 RepID=A0A5C6U8L5_9SPHN|nr:lytic transglycosylase domain-containing protein [Sphingorhabdus soli]TXC69114.1 lytic transglycosylase domain-containing protein [Sphingorhabdus soli]
MIAPLRQSLILCVAASGLVAMPALASEVLAATVSYSSLAPMVSVDSGIDAGERQRAKAILQAIRDQRWSDVEQMLASAQRDQLTPLLTAEYYLAANSPEVPLDRLMALLRQAPNLPQAAQLGRLAQRRGATELPPLPTEAGLRWSGSAPIRARGKSVTDDPVGVALGTIAQQMIVNDDPAGAERALNDVASQLSPAALTEWQQRVAWSYYIENRDADALRLARMAQQGTGDWRVQADWIAALAAWRLDDCRYAAASFDKVVQGTSDSELKAAGAYWASRAYLACGEPHLVQSRLRTAAGQRETFYGFLAMEALGLPEPSPAVAETSGRGIASKPNVRMAAALAEMGEHKLADQLLRHQAKIGPASDHDELLAVARSLNLAETQLYLAYNTPGGKRPDEFARYPAPSWQPENGWRVDPALVYAHTLQESGFRRDVVSSAGAYGLMQVRPGTAQDLAKVRGSFLEKSDLARPEVNIEYGQSYLEKLRDSAVTGGLLPKVIAAYNAGPSPVARWNTEVNDKGDPLLYIESLPYWETRGYVAIILRNYWMYERQEGRGSVTQNVLAQNHWPRFPDAKGGTRLSLNQP